MSPASGATTVPMSRPSATQSPSPSSARCFSTSAARTLGSVATFEAASDTSGVRIASVTSSPSRITRSPSRMSISRGSPPRSATARYIAPESR